MIRNYAAGDREAAGALWADNAPRQGYAPRSRAEVDGMLFGHPYFSPEHAFVLEEGGALRALICGCTGDDIPRGDERGYFTCLIADAVHDTDETAQTLFGALEASFRAKGKTYGAVTFFNPMRLPWVIPGTPGYEHNNMPGIAADLPLHGRMLRRGYRETSRECSMFRDLSDFTVPDSAGAFAAKLAKQGFAIGRYDSERHTGLHEMLVSFENPDWMKQVTEAAEKRMLLPVALAGSRVAGFAGPVYPEPTGRGYFAGIGIMPEYQHRGLGSLLFYRLCEEEKQVGAKYMSLFTGEDNPAKKIYESAGFRTARVFGVMLKKL